MLGMLFELGQKEKLSHLTFSIKKFHDVYYETVIQRISEGEQERATATLREIERLFLIRKPTVSAWM